MNPASANSRWRENWQVFFATALSYFFLSGSTFTSLGVVLFTMASDLHWSMTAAGFCFSLLGIACGVASPLPALVIKRIGGRATMVVGTAMLCCGFFLASRTEAIETFYVAMVLLGAGYSFAGNVPGVYLIAARFIHGAPRVIGLYFMIGAAGSAIGPLVVQSIVSMSSWHSLWEVMAYSSAALGVLCLALVRDVNAAGAAQAETAASVRPPEVKWTPRAAILTWQFIVVAAAQTMTTACLFTDNSIMVAHLVHLGSPQSQGAVILSTIALAGMVVKGAAGRLCEGMRPTHVAALGLALQAVSNFLLANAATAALQFSGAIVFGTGWGLTYVGATIVLLNYFGRDTGARILSVVWMITTIAAVGPIAAGILADNLGTMAAIFQVYGAILIVLVPVFAMMKAPEQGADQLRGKSLAISDAPFSNKL